MDRGSGLHHDRYIEQTSVSPNSRKLNSQLSQKIRVASSIYFSKVVVKANEEDLQLGACRNYDSSKFRPSKIFPRYEIVLQGGFPSVFCDRYFDRSKGLTERGPQQLRGDRPERREGTVGSIFATSPRSASVSLQCG